jgi:hypothetical protein
MLAGFFICAPAAARRCGRSKAIVACSVPTAPCPARRSKPSAWVKARPPAVGRERRDRRSRCKHARLVAQTAHESGGVVDSSGRPRRHPVRPDACASSGVDHRARVDGERVHPQRAALWPHPLPLHRTLLSCHDPAGAPVRRRYLFCRVFRLDDAGRRHSCRRQNYLVGDGAGLGHILVVGAA